jgi:hypothetical protein
MEKCKSLLLENGQVFLTKSSEASGKIAKLACSWIPNGAVNKKNTFETILKLSYLLFKFRAF